MADASTAACVASWSRDCLNGALGGGGTFIALLALQTGLVRATRREMTAAAAGGDLKRTVTFMDLIVTGDDNRYSLSRLQAYLWTGLVVTTFAATCFATGAWTKIPETLIALMGVSTASAVAASAITAVKSTGPPAVNPQASFVRDLFFDSTSTPSLDLPRTQMFVWTVVVAVTYLVLFLQKFPGETLPAGLPDVPAGLVALMGVSQGTYLAAKAAEKPR